jgi:hypothetical protein
MYMPGEKGSFGRWEINGGAGKICLAITCAAPSRQAACVMQKDSTGESSANLPKTNVGGWELGTSAELSLCFFELSPMLFFCHKHTTFDLRTHNPPMARWLWAYEN